MGGGSQYGHQYKYTKLREKLDKVCQGRSKIQTKGKAHTKCTVPGNKIKKIIIWELIVPWEEHVEEAYERKKFEYDEVLEIWKNNGWNASCTPREISSRGFVARYLYKVLSDIDLAGTRKGKAIETIIKTAEKTNGCGEKEVAHRLPNKHII